MFSLSWTRRWGGIWRLRRLKETQLSAPTTRSSWTHSTSSIGRPTWDTNAEPGSPAGTAHEDRLLLEHGA